MSVLQDDTIKRESENGLTRLIQFSCNHPEEWECLINMDMIEPGPERRWKLIEALEEAGLSAIAYLAVYNCSEKSREMEVIKEQIHNELAAKVPAGELMELIKSVMHAKIK